MCGNKSHANKRVQWFVPDLFSRISVPYTLWGCLTNSVCTCKGLQEPMKSFTFPDTCVFFVKLHTMAISLNQDILAHLSKRLSDLKQNGTQEKPPFSSKGFSFKNPFTWGDRFCCEKLLSFLQGKMITSKWGALKGFWINTTTTYEGLQNCLMHCFTV